ncbi:MAG: DUF58 domain-containing protein [Verrucomicrobia bacterium]|nr:DUF58 domain-containing protein [Verrucomicrobiota bacterium]
MPETQNRPLLTPAFLRQLEQLQLVARRVLKGQQHGERRSRARGHSVEFADFRNYSVGDDFRYLDWNLYARLEKLFLKLYEEEQELRATLFLDASESMGFGNPVKLDAARRIAAALGYIALANFDAVGCVAMGTPDEAASDADGSAPSVTSGAVLRPIRSRKMSHRLFDFLMNIHPAGGAELNAGLRKHALSVQRGGVAMVFSDLLEPAGFENGLTALQSRGCDLCVFHILSPEERSPDFSGDFRLVDSETGAAEEVSFPRVRRTVYEKSVASWCASIRSFCRKRGILYLPVGSETPFEDVVLKTLRKTGALK